MACLLQYLFIHQIAARDADIRVLKTDLNSAQKKIKNHSNEVRRSFHGMVICYSCGFKSTATGLECLLRYQLMKTGGLVTP